MQHDTENSRIAELEADNQRLLRLLDQRDAPTELRHRLRGTLALLRSVIRQSTHGRTDVAAYAAHLEDRLDSLMRIQAHVDLSGEVDLSTLIADELFAYELHEGDRVLVSGPTICLKPRAAQALGLAIHELAVNAIEHGALPTGCGRIDITWQVERSEVDPILVLTWRETGSTSLRAPSHRGFGTELLTEMLKYDLRAETILSYDEDGVRCAIRCPFPPSAGHVVDRT